MQLIDCYLKKQENVHQNYHFAIFHLYENLLTFGIAPNLQYFFVIIRTFNPI